MERTIFLKEFATYFELEISEIEFEVKFKELQEWDSVQALVLVAFLEDEFNIPVTREIYDKLITIEDIYHLISV